MQVAHDLSEFQDGQERILVLKDSSILENEEFNFGASFQKNKLLPQYDEVIEGEKQAGFVIDNDGMVNISEEQRRSEVSEKLKLKPISLDYDKMKEIKDYYTKEEAEITFNKPKNFDDVSFVDDDDLQQALARARKMASKKVSKTSVEEIVRTLTQYRETLNDDINDEIPGKGLVISDTSEFVRSLTVTQALPKPVPDAESITPVPKVTEQVNEEVKEEEEEGQEETMQDIEMQDSVEQDKNHGWKVAADAGGHDMPKIQEEIQLTGIVEEEPLVSSGMAATLALLQQKGLSIKPSLELLEKERIQKERQKWLAEQKKKDLERQTEREREKQKSKEKGHRGGGGRDTESSYRDREHLREVETRFKDYKPDINLEYVDEFGNQLTQKEAFRQLSHKFHGKTSGKAKTEKRLKKLEEERKLKAMSSIDTPLNMATALQERQKASGSAHVVLSVGNRAVAPPSMLSKNERTGSSSKSNGTSSTIARPSIITVNGGLTGQSMNAPEREKVTFGLKRKADAEPEKPTKKTKEQ
ncbi:22104_t:CDS:10 [Entrophospora sp. SA101]|nr:3438_t:CDS:10 [Entrophospora sp. SA101]CAJ0627703.1 1994_t:CDS:10 [Entrophospora sp. SA101]CAJ0627704.1 1995_t:CDS:10 [Entrophospora sp. SA101]CAJ0757414.1 22104_t:CDS:10 [Entrophospora sp. SA101]CAJ0828998.1 14383_t:CDS:10 [Entrophospora sp. SA101]